MKLTVRYLKQIGFIFGCHEYLGNTQGEEMYNGAVAVCTDMPLPWPFWNVKNRGKSLWCSTTQELQLVVGWDAQVKMGFDFRKK